MSLNLEPTLTALVGLQTRNDPWTIYPAPRIRMTDIEHPDGNLQGGPHLSLSTNEPVFHSAFLWRYYPSSSGKSIPEGLIYPKEDKQLEHTVDPWCVLLNQNPPFYRRYATKPPYESGTYRCHTEWDKNTVPLHGNKPNAEY